MNKIISFLLVITSAFTYGMDQLTYWFPLERNPTSFSFEPMPKELLERGEVTKIWKDFSSLTKTRITSTKTSGLHPLFSLLPTAGCWRVEQEQPKDSFFPVLSYVTYKKSLSLKSCAVNTEGVYSVIDTNTLKNFKQSSPALIREIASIKDSLNESCINNPDKQNLTKKRKRQEVQDAGCFFRKLRKYQGKHREGAI